ncbi:MAG: 50S ribosomal protein L20, partial [Bacteroidota bacterium]
MPRSQNKVAGHRRRKKILSKAKGYWGGRSKVYTIAKHHVEKALTHAYRHRRAKKREYRGLWITRISAAARLHG